MTPPSALRFLSLLAASCSVCCSRVWLRSLAFMLRLEKSSDPRHTAVPTPANQPRKAANAYRPSVKGGWLCDEMGMGVLAHTEFRGWTRLCE